MDIWVTVRLSQCRLSLLSVGTWLRLFQKYKIIILPVDDKIFGGAKVEQSFNSKWFDRYYG